MTRACHMPSARRLEEAFVAFSTSIHSHSRSLVSSLDRYHHHIRRYIDMYRVRGTSDRWLPRSTPPPIDAGGAGGHGPDHSVAFATRQHGSLVRAFGVPSVCGWHCHMTARYRGCVWGVDTWYDDHHHHHHLRHGHPVYKHYRGDDLAIPPEVPSEYNMFRIPVGDAREAVKHAGASSTHGTRTRTSTMMP
jgi:hypothetical protein